MKLCECGCGASAPISRRTYRAKGIVKGEPLRFIPHHHGRRSLDIKFWSKISKDSRTGCWIWQGTLVCGYGQLLHQGKRWRAHRLSYVLRHGPVPAELFVCHNCPGGDNPRCVNPDHLFLDTPLVNARDKITKGTIKKGGQINTTKVTPEIVIAIREARALGERVQILAAKYGLSIGAIWQIYTGRSWSHIGGPLTIGYSRQRKTNE